MPSVTREKTWKWKVACDQCYRCESCVTSPSIFCFKIHVVVRTGNNGGNLHQAAEGHKMSSYVELEIGRCKLAHFLPFRAGCFQSQYNQLHCLTAQLYSRIGKATRNWIRSFETCTTGWKLICLWTDRQLTVQYSSGDWAETDTTVQNQQLYLGLCTYVMLWMTLEQIQ